MMSVHVGFGVVIIIFAFIVFNSITRDVCGISSSASEGNLKQTKQPDQWVLDIVDTKCHP